MVRFDGPTRASIMAPVDVPWVSMCQPKPSCRGVGGVHLSRATQLDDTEQHLGQARVALADLIGSGPTARTTTTNRNAQPLRPVGAAAETSVNSNRESERVFVQNGRTDGELIGTAALS